ncbi:hypothetical protein BJ508DRAFT_111527 [Ascobolus immersus RN42]|uniref:Fungal N-terminal domain-containing protein n=1 Tax=Ascobolus immersus RN42 TaxID=1160509 RepID=A0A3N4I6D1_ASCIM|nr:hypothetical protein BJ508DRAFT_111527 [Ascobolus immersus RN42]
MSSTALLSTLPSTIATGMQLFQLFEEMKAAPIEIKDIKREITELSSILQKLHLGGAELVPAASDTCGTEPEDVEASVLRGENEKNLGAVLGSCNTILQQTSKLLEKYNARGKNGFVQGMDRLSWSVDGQKKATKLKKSLEASKLTLNIALGLMMHQRLEAARKTMSLVHGATEATAGRMGHIHENTEIIISQIRGLLGRLDEDEIGSLIAGVPSEHSVMLRRYLQSASTYAESTISIIQHEPSTPRIDRGIICAENVTDRVEKILLQIIADLSNDSDDVLSAYFSESFLDRVERILIDLKKLLRERRKLRRKEDDVAKLFDAEIQRLRTKELEFRRESYQAKESEATAQYETLTRNFVRLKQALQ